MLRINQRIQIKVVTMAIVRGNQHAKTAQSEYKMQLEHHPFLGRIPRHPKLREYGYRALVVETYLVFYIVCGRTVEIHRVVHGSRNRGHLI